MKKDDKVLNEFVGELNKRFGNHLKNIILFGSRARGDYGPDSDYDFLLVLDCISRDYVDTVDQVAADFLYKYNLVFSAFPVSESNYSKQQYNPLYMNIRHDGISIAPRPRHNYFQ